MPAIKLVLALFAANLLLGGTAVPSAFASTPEQQSHCVFDKHEPVSVAPFTVDSGMDWGSYSFTGGAQLFVPAREGLTREWLAASVQHALASAHREPNSDGSSAKAICDMPRLKDVHVGVVSAGNGFWVQLIARDSRTSEALMKWARNLVDVRNKSAR